MVSQAEKKFIIDGCAENLRYDGRGFSYIIAIVGVVL
jgi:hypothetical protein